MNAKELAALLDGREYRSEMTKAEQSNAQADGLVVVFGASDDLMEFRGAIDEELSAYNGTTAYLTSEGLLQNECENESCPYCKREAAKAVTIKALWCDETPNHESGLSPAWTFKTDIPHEAFEIVEDGEPYCRGIVFALKDVVTA